MVYFHLKKKKKLNNKMSKNFCIFFFFKQKVKYITRNHLGLSFKFFGAPRKGRGRVTPLKPAVWEEWLTFLVEAGASMDTQANVSTIIRLCIQTNYNPYIHCNKTITINKYDNLMYILYLMLTISISSYII